jgi:hypothetical protein
MNSGAATFAENNVRFSVFSLSFRAVNPRKTDLFCCRRGFFTFMAGWAKLAKL